MLRSLILTATLGAALSGLAGTATAQIGYPAGYGGYGWNGWGGGGTSYQGDVARGMGVWAAGAGYYNEQTAEARSINANTAMNWNEYWYESQQNVNRKYYAKVAAHNAENIKSREAMYLRLRDNPTKYDIYRGDAMNVLLDQIGSPKIYLRGLKSAGIKYKGEFIRDLPFQYAQAAITSSVHGILTKGSAPAILRTEPYRPEMLRLREIADKILSQDEKESAIDPETLDEAEALLKKAQAKVAVNIKAGTKDRNDCDRYLKSALGLTHMLRTPAINVLLSDVEKHPETTVGDLIAFMKSFNLRFGVADDARERAAYDELYPIMLKMRDEAFPTAKPELGTETEANAEHPAEFFSKMEDKHIAPSDTPPPPKPAAK